LKNELNVLLPLGELRFVRDVEDPNSSSSNGGEAEGGLLFKAISLLPTAYFDEYLTALYCNEMFFSVL
jgi:hypothetical protein